MPEKQLFKTSRIQGVGKFSGETTENNTEGKTVLVKIKKPKIYNIIKNLKATLYQNIPQIMQINGFNLLEFQISCTILKVKVHFLTFPIF